jgi:hypothetical protein
MSFWIDLLGPFAGAWVIVTLMNFYERGLLREGIALTVASATMALCVAVYIADKKDQKRVRARNV